MSICYRMMKPMMGRMAEEGKEEMVSKNGKRTVESVVAACAWGLFFIWTGIALLADVGWAAGLLGVGVITLGAQVTRKHFGLRVEVFWVIVGFFFVVGGVWESLDLRVGLLPILCIAIGLVLFVSTLVGKRHDAVLK